LKIREFDSAAWKFHGSHGLEEFADWVVGIDERDRAYGVVADKAEENPHHLNSEQ
jgi:hypothetical protein